MAENETQLRIDPQRTALIIQDLQNDVMVEGGAFADSGAPQHAKEQNVVEKMRMSAWEGTKLEVLLAGLGVDTIVITGAWTNMSIEHTARTGADKGYFMVVPEDCCSTMSADWHNASINYALQNVSTVTNCAAVLEALGAAAPA